MMSGYAAAQKNHQGPPPPYGQSPTTTTTYHRNNPKELFDHISFERWRSAYSVLRSSPSSSHYNGQEQARYVNPQNGWTPLHMACCRGAPPDFIRELLKKNTRAARIQEHWGRGTPLHQYLIHHHPSSSFSYFWTTRNNRLDYEVVRDLKSAYPRACLLRASGELTPLNALCCYLVTSRTATDGEVPNIVKLLLLGGSGSGSGSGGGGGGGGAAQKEDYVAEQVAIPNIRGETPLMTLTDRVLREFDVAYQSYYGPEVFYNSSFAEYYGGGRKNLSAVMETCQILVHAAADYQKRRTATGLFNGAHGTIAMKQLHGVKNRFAPACSGSCVRDALLLYDCHRYFIFVWMFLLAHQEQIFQTDEDDGNFILHLLAAATSIDAGTKKLLWHDEKDSHACFVCGACPIIGPRVVHDQNYSSAATAAGENGDDNDDTTRNDYEQEKMMKNEVWCLTCSDRVEKLSDWLRHEGPACLAVECSWTNIITYILHLCPRLASIPNNRGRLPLHIAIESGKPFGCGIRAILEAEPRALETRDMLTHMFPFMIAGVQKENFSKSSVEQDRPVPPECGVDPSSTTEQPPRLSQLSTVYNLLLSDPALVCRGIDEK